MFLYRNYINLALLKIRRVGVKGNKPAEMFLVIYYVKL